MVVSPPRWRAPALPSGPCTKAAERRGSFRARAYGQGVAIATSTAYGLQARRAPSSRRSATPRHGAAGNAVSPLSFPPLETPFPTWRQRRTWPMADPPFQQGIHQRGKTAGGTSAAAVMARTAAWSLFISMPLTPEAGLPSARRRPMGCRAGALSHGREHGPDHGLSPRAYRHVFLRVSEPTGGRTQAYLASHLLSYGWRLTPRVRPRPSVTRVRWGFASLFTTTHAPVSG